jgi:hypothetical protein
MKPFKKGFVQKCAEYGIDKEAAKELFRKIAGDGVSPPAPPSNTVGQVGYGGGKTVVPAPANILANAKNLTAKTVPGQKALDSMAQAAQSGGGGPASAINARQDALGTALGN